MRLREMSTPKVAAIVTGVIVLLGVSRAVSLFCEAYATVREERNQDTELIELCARGDARTSPKMRAACLQARSDRASPVLAKALVYAFNTAIRDFTDAFGSPFKLSMLALFLLSSVVSPLVSWLRAVSGLAKMASAQEQNADFASNSHFMIMPPDTQKQAWKRRMARHLPMLRNKAHIHSPSGSESDDDYESGRENTTHTKYE